MVRQTKLRFAATLLAPASLLCTAGGANAAVHELGFLSGGTTTFEAY